MSDANNEQIKIFFVRKPENLSNLKSIFAKRESHEYEISIVKETVTFTEKEYDDFTSDFFVNRDFLSGKGGSCKKGFYQTIKIIAPDRETLFVNPEGHGYARYVGFQVFLPPELDKLTLSVARHLPLFNKSLRMLTGDYDIRKIEIYETFIHITFESMFDRENFKTFLC
jgi:hypothetical protein